MKKDEIRVKIPRLHTAEKTQIPRFGVKFRDPRKTGP